MTNVIRLYNFTLESENEFTKIFKDGDIEIYLSKAFDEDSGIHYLVASVPKISEVDASDIKYPFPFDTDVMRDEFFKIFDTTSAKEFTRDLVAFIKEQKQKENENMR
jgi:hypothetical protein